MDFYIGIRRVVFILFILFITTSCKSTKETVISDKKYERQEIITKQYPYRIEVSEKLKYKPSGELKPVIVELSYNEVKGTVKVDGNDITYVMESKDTIISSKVIKEKTDISLDTKIEPIKKEPLTLWGKFKVFGRKIFLWSILLNIIFIASKIYSMSRRVYMPF